jgi:hypothetical protein
MYSIGPVQVENMLKIKQPVNFGAISSRKLFLIVILTIASVFAREMPRFA